MKVASREIYKNWFVGDVAKAAEWQRSGATIIHLLTVKEVWSLARKVVIDNRITCASAIDATTTTAITGRGVADYGAVDKHAAGRASTIATRKIIPQYAIV